MQAGGDITVASTTQTLEGGGFHQYGIMQVDRVAGLYVVAPA
jgi:filamentous hemagglutinin